jgi:pyridoxamine 5'-phosphate oxidase
MKDSTEILQNLRQSYLLANLDIKDCVLNPLEQFQNWFDEARGSKCDEPNAFVLSTVQNSRPHSRVVLLKGIHQGQFTFYTNYLSAKAHQIESNPLVAMNFLWLPLQRQVRIEGRISKVDPTLSDTYFQKRPRGSQLGAIASPQSQKMQSRGDLEELFRINAQKYESQEVLPRPENWGGYQIEADYFEFWQGRDNRMHDRICYQKNAQTWELSRLAP